MYGMGHAAVASKLNIDKAHAKMITQAFFDEFSAVQTWMNETKK